MGKRTSLILILAVFLGLYSYVYFHLTYFVFFNFDMPRVALIVKDFIEHGTFLTSQNYFEESVWRNIPWGPSMVFFYALFLNFTSDPLAVSYMLSIVNLIAILILVYVLWKHFSKSVAIASLFLLTINPYWVTYVRIIYQPSPITFFIPLSMALFFEAAFNKKWWAMILLPVSWVALIQVYIPTYSFILTSLIFLLFFITEPKKTPSVSSRDELDSDMSSSFGGNPNLMIGEDVIKKSQLKFYALGIVLSALLLTPSALFLNSHREYLTRYIDAPTLFTPAEKTFSERLTKVVTSYILIPVGGVFEHQTGYGQNDFVEDYLPAYPYVTPVLSAIFICALIWNLYKGVFKKDYKRLIICLWAVTPVWSMVVLWVSDILPRYYLHAFPAIMILIALFLADLIKISKFFVILPIGIIIYWFIFNNSYNNFIRDYDYPNGRFRDVAETPYICLDQAVKWVVADADNKKCEPIITNNEENPNFDVWLETKYIWEYIYKRSTNHLSTNLNPCYYVINYKNKVRELGITNYKVFGLFTVFNYNEIKN